jgi:HK97 family phage portal protein
MAMISTTKTFFNSRAVIKETRRSSLDTDEHDVGILGTGKIIPDKIAVKGLTFDQMQAVYEIHCWVRACIDGILSRAADISPLIKPVQFQMTDEGKFTDELKTGMDQMAAVLTKPNISGDSFTAIQKQVLLDVLKFDAGSFELVKSTYNDAGLELYPVPGHTIKLNKNKKGLFTTPKQAYIQIDTETLRPVASWSLDRMAYLMANPQSDKVYGLSNIETLVSTVTADLYAESFNMDFFTNQATPRFAVLYEGLAQGQQDDTMVRFRKWWDRELKGKYHRPIVLTTEGAGKIQFQKVGLSNEEMQFQEYSRWLLQKVMAIYKVQPIIIGLIDENMGKLNSSEQLRIFKANALKPLLSLWADQFNRKVVWNETGGLGRNDVYLDYDLDLVDKKEQADWHQIYLQNGVLTINEIRVKGLGLFPVPWGNVPYLQNNLLPFGDGAVPAIPASEENLVQTPEETTAAPNAIAAKYLQGLHLTKAQWSKSVKFGHQPIGWENIPPSERVIILGQLIDERRKMLNKTYSIPERIS